MRGYIAALQGVRFVCATEPAKGRRFDEGRLKALTGGDRQRAHFMRQDGFDFMPELKLWIAANNKPRITDTTRAMWRRVKLIPFNVTIPERNQDKHLEDKLETELSGILRWALEGCLAWQHEGTRTPSSVIESTKDYREEEDPLTDFFEQSEELEVDKFARIKSTVFYEKYKDYCEQIGDKRPWTMTRLAAEMKERGFGKERIKQDMVWKGIGLKSESA